jgi:serine O-acetyltransferase
MNRHTDTTEFGVPRDAVTARRGRDPDWVADLKRCGVRRPLLKEQSLWAIGVYRFGRRLEHRPPGWVKRILTPVYWLSFRFVETLLGISLPRTARIGAGLRIWHFGGIFLHGDVVIGENCTLRQGVTIGNRTEGGPVPVLGNEVDVGAYAQILGGVRIGDGARIGALSVVLEDVPAGCTAVGIPARIVARTPGTAALPVKEAAG